MTTYRSAAVVVVQLVAASVESQLAVSETDRLDPKYPVDKRSVVSATESAHHPKSLAAAESDALDNPVEKQLAATVADQSAPKYLILLSCLP
jgi:hypothetical protein